MKHSDFFQVLAVLCMCLFISGGKAIAYSDAVFIDFKEDPASAPFYSVRSYKININNTNSKWTELTCPTGKNHYIRFGYASSGTLQMSKVRELSCKVGENISESLKRVVADLGGEGIWVTMKYTDIQAVYTTGIEGHPEATTDYVHRLCFFATTSDDVQGREGEPLGCGFPSPTNVSCQITPANINFNYSAVSSKELNGNTMKKDLSVNCTAATDALIYLTTGIGSSDNYNGKISLDSSGNLSAKVKIDDTEPSPDGISVKFNSGVNSLPVSTTLQSTGDISAGKYSGSAILTISPQ